MSRVVGAVKSYLEFEIDGFRSLRGTKFRIDSGLNVLVGPNGSGKTNVIAALDFLSTFIRDGAYAAVSKLGGAARVFSNEGFKDVKNRKISIDINISGVHPYFDAKPFVLNEGKASRKKSAPKYIQFSYGVKIALIRPAFILQVSEESISWKLLNSAGKELSCNNLFVNAQGKEHCATDYNFDPEKFFGTSDFLSEKMIEDLLRQMNKAFEDPMADACKFAIDGHSLFKWTAPAMVPELVGVERALTFGRSFNISPEKVRAPEDIASKNEMMSDGSGTVSQLYKARPDGRSSKSKKLAKAIAGSSYGKVIDNFKKLNEEISDLDIQPDVQTGKLDCQAKIGSGAKSISLPLSSLSDGSAKWLAVLTIVRLFKANYCIEEPENYLHPRAQRVFIEVLRGLVNEEEARYFIITTHSESIVSVSNVHELRICDYVEGATNIRTVDDVDAVNEAINDTGFGLGFFYANDRI